MSFADELAVAYVRARTRNPKLRKGQFMQQAFPERYKNEESAYQAYNQTVKKRRSGQRIQKLNKAAQPPIQSQKVKDDIAAGRIKRRGAPSGRRKGEWKVNITLRYIDDNGNQATETRSFVAISSQYTTLVDKPYLQEILAAAADEYVDKWVADYESIAPNYTDKEIEVVPIYRHDAQTFLDIDEYEEFGTMSSLEIEDY